MPFQLTFCQQAGNQHQKNQDALFNGKAVYQWQLKNAESYLLDNEKVIFGVADGVSSHPRNHLASHYLMALLSQCQSLDSQWLRQAHGDFCVKLAKDYFGTSCTFVACELHHNGRGRVVNVGDSRAYKITANGEWQQLSFDHTILAEMKQQGLVKEGSDYASMYNGLTDCIVADFDADDFRIHIAEFQLEKGESILLCSDGLHEQLAPKAIQAIWDGYGSPSHRLQICRKMVKMHRLYDDFSAVICEIV
ncbi:MAG: protein phosphatase 2C domain-containing protein [Lonepinella koalarum]|nr:protein phosphatase 2C domain-containing protein [Lonepinella koalarum]